MKTRALIDPTHVRISTGTPSRPRQLLQRRAELLLERGVRLIGQHRVQRLVDGVTMVAEIVERRHQIVAPASPCAGARSPAPATPASAFGRRSRSSTTMRSAVFLPTPGMRVSRATSPRWIAPTSSRGSMPESTASASFGPMPLIAISRSNTVSSSARGKAEERELILAHVRVHAQRDLGAGSPAV